VAMDLQVLDGAEIQGRTQLHTRRELTSFFTMLELWQRSKVVLVSSQAIPEIKKIQRGKDAWQTCGHITKFLSWLCVSKFICCGKSLFNNLFIYLFHL